VHTSAMIATRTIARPRLRVAMVDVCVWEDQGVVSSDRRSLLTPDQRLLKSKKGQK